MVIKTRVIHTVTGYYDGSEWIQFANWLWLEAILNRFSASARLWYATCACWEIHWCLGDVNNPHLIRIRG